MVEEFGSRPLREAACVAEAGTYSRGRSFSVVVYTDGSQSEKGVVGT